MKRLLFMLILALLPTMGSAQIAAKSRNTPRESSKESSPKFASAPFEFEITGDNTCTLIDYDAKSLPADRVINIPSSVDYNSKNYAVTSIKGGLSRLIFYFRKEIVTVNIPSSVTTIGFRAFASASIESIEIPSSVTSIEDSAFASCRSLKSINIPSSVKRIESRAFGACFSLTEVNIKSPMIAIDDLAFYGCLGLRIIKIDANNVTMGKNVFYQCRSLREIHVKEAVRPYVQGIKSNPLIAIIDEPQQTVAPTNRYIAAAPAAQQPIAETPKIISDVDQNIPQTTLKNDKTFAVIIANEKYTTESTVNFALNDGKVFKEYCEKTLGIPTENIRFVENGTLGSIGAGIGWLKKVLEVYKQDANAIVYYSGHGIPNEANGDAYILPTDCHGSDFQYAYSINRLYKELGEAGAKSVTYFIDACFSGTQRKGEMMVAARGVAIKAKSGVLSGNSVAFAAASGDETAFAYEDKGHGMFTYFLLKKLQESKGQVSYGELADYIQQNVKQKSIVVSPRLQSPNAIPSTTASDVWQSWKLTK